ncbi:hypothetical protein ElyMa_000572400 [Elysia marginata]|uniref:Uncharacterized protein n=1 Tax=Elysia marginata TaxID=1093978 RepID=A0AAV4G3H8_9GAST|nr:hypothetical protein ElyMa_000572400 [Elysia marginata]
MCRGVGETDGLRGKQVVLVETLRVDDDNNRRAFCRKSEEFRSTPFSYIRPLKRQVDPRRPGHCLDGSHQCFRIQPTPGAVAAILEPANPRPSPPKTRRHLHRQPIGICPQGGIVAGTSSDRCGQGHGLSPITFNLARNPLVRSVKESLGNQHFRPGDPDDSLRRRHSAASPDA